ncbi:hypothetical protein BKA62DRAFT_708216 [Auriculariales sp. MPI-PUGE-AT-0066]|nr:hypothetical protein BKA62DRAFT_708216 [Auriculariales sp. MPI-PUGE-AT-0066]
MSQDPRQSAAQSDDPSQSSPSIPDPDPNAGENTDTESGSSSTASPTKTTILVDPSSTTATSSDSSWSNSGSADFVTTSDDGSLPTLGAPPENVTITIPFAAFVVPPVLVVTGIIGFFAWRYWRRKKAAKAHAEEMTSLQPFFSAEPQTPGDHSDASSRVEMGLASNKALSSFKTAPGGESGVGVPLLVPASSTSASSSDYPSRSAVPEKLRRFQDEKQQQQPEESDEAQQHHHHERGDAFAQYSDALNVAMQRVGFSPQALLESLNRVGPSGPDPLLEGFAAPPSRRSSIDRVSLLQPAAAAASPTDDARPPAYDYAAHSRV